MISSLPAYRFFSAIRRGISMMQGGHQLAQKSTSTSLPREALSDTGLPDRSGRVKAGATGPGGSGAASRNGGAIKANTAAKNKTAFMIGAVPDGKTLHTFPGTSSAMGGGIALLHPIGAEIVRDVEHLQILEAQRRQRLPGIGDIGTT